MIVIFFDGRPKETREELYGRENELRLLHSSLSEPIVLLTGIRRIGKTSILKVFLNEMDIQHALIDVRFPITSFRTLYSALSEALSQLNKKGSLSSALGHIKGISFFGLSVSLSWKPEERASLLEIMDRVCETGRVVIAFDDTQNMRGKLGHEVLSLLAHCYDYCKNTTFILTGSEAGLLYDFLKIEDPSSPLYGRHIEEVRVSRFDEQNSLTFLKEGFRQAGIDAPKEVLECAVNTLDGIAGWLTEFGHRSVRIGKATNTVVEEVLQVAANSAISELSHFSSEYITMIRALSNGYERWGELKEYLERKNKRVVYDAELRRYLVSLEKRGYVTRTDRGRYTLIDPVIKNAFTQSGPA